jgi:hypothetical protein
VDIIQNCTGKSTENYCRLHYDSPLLVDSMRILENASGALAGAIAKQDEPVAGFTCKMGFRRHFEPANPRIP